MVCYNLKCIGIYLILQILKSIYFILFEDSNMLNDEKFLLFYIIEENEKFVLHSTILFILLVKCHSELSLMNFEF